jgi:hypothetical protein
VAAERQETVPQNAVLKSAGHLNVQSLFSYTQAADDFSVPIYVFMAQIIEQAPALAH